MSRILDRFYPQRAFDRAMRTPCPLPAEPTDCPKCSARIERSGEEWTCVGLRDRADVEKYLALSCPEGVPEFLRSRSPCGWHGRAADYRAKWG